MNNLIVDKKYQGRGIGTALLEAMVRKVEKLKPYWFQTDGCDKSTERLYAREGFVKDRERLDVFLNRELETYSGLSKELA